MATRDFVPPRPPGEYAGTPGHVPPNFRRKIRSQIGHTNRSNLPAAFMQSNASAGMSGTLNGTVLTFNGTQSAKYFQDLAFASGHFETNRAGKDLAALSLSRDVRVPEGAQTARRPPPVPTATSLMTSFDRKTGALRGGVATMVPTADGDAVMTLPRLRLVDLEAAPKSFLLPDIGSSVRQKGVSLSARCTVHRSQSDTSCRPQLPPPPEVATVEAAAKPLVVPSGPPPAPRRRPAPEGVVHVRSVDNPQGWSHAEQRFDNTTRGLGIAQLVQGDKIARLAAREEKVRHRREREERTFAAYAGHDSKVLANHDAHIAQRSALRQQYHDKHSHVREMRNFRSHFF